MRRVGQEYRNKTDRRIKKRIADGKMARLYDWWEINQVKNVSKANNPHPCPIPYELARRIILTTTEPGETVVDPFCGSGTVVQAAVDSGRHGLGFDVDPKYADHAAGRILTPLDEDTKPVAEVLSPVCGACSQCYEPCPEECAQVDDILGAVAHL
jgi:DNA modification methylase